MYDVYLIDFVGHELRLLKSELTWKKAKRLAKKLNQKDRFSLAFVVPLDFDFDSLA
jgi:hypothetical protein